jgi:hypothetical protein
MDNEIIFFDIMNDSQNNDKNLKDNKYRFYHCYQKNNGLICKLIDNSDVKSYESNSKLLFINNCVPKMFDSCILLYKYAPKNITIEK